MRSKKSHTAKPAKPVYRELPASQGAPEIEPGAVGQAAITAAALNQLNRYAQEIQDYLEASRMETLLNELNTELHPERRLRLRRD